MRLYQGPERRHHRVFVTRNSEYHCRDSVCVAVRDRRTGAFVHSHSAIGRTLRGSVLLTEEGVESSSPPSHPRPGEQLYFTSGTPDDLHDVLTSPLVRVQRPLRQDVAEYAQA
jgi:hypothetical protein